MGNDDQPWFRGNGRTNQGLNHSARSRPTMNQTKCIQATPNQTRTRTKTIPPPNQTRTRTRTKPPRRAEPTTEPDVPALPSVREPRGISSEAATYLLSWKPQPHPHASLRSFLSRRGTPAGSPPCPPRRAPPAYSLSASTAAIGRRASRSVGGATTPRAADSQAVYCKATHFHRIGA
eukprot:COSAG06_NODE_3525_length_5227_cov_37.738105_2_plen_177_part_00